MGREVRRVPADWEHPKSDKHRQGDGYQPLYDEDYQSACEDWRKRFAAWEGGERQKHFQESGKDYEFWDYDGMPPDKEYYRPAWRDEERTHYQMYENVTEGTPISPVFPTPEELAKWLAENNANAGAGMTATYEQWLRVCKGGYAPSMVFGPKGIQSGVAALTD